MKYINIIFLFIIIFITFSYKEIDKEYNYVLNSTYLSDIPTIKEDIAIETFYGTVTAYEPNCVGCIGITASGYDVLNTIYYNDLTYGKIRIVAADKSIPFGTIIKLSNINNYDEIIAIVLDRGGAIGFNNSSLIDLLFKTEEDSYLFGRKYNVKIDILRYGY